MTPGQELSRLLLTAFWRAYKNTDTGDLQEVYLETAGAVEPEDYNICLAWASEQMQMISESKGKHVPLGETLV